MHKEWEIRIGKVGHFEYEDIYWTTDEDEEFFLFIWNENEWSIILCSAAFSFRSRVGHFTCTLIWKWFKGIQNTHWLCRDAISIEVFISRFSWMTDKPKNMHAAGSSLWKKNKKCYFFWIYYFYRCLFIPHHQVFIGWPLCGRFFFFILSIHFEITSL